MFLGHYYPPLCTNVYFISYIPSPSVWEGSQTPNLNGYDRFLRGGTDEEALTLEDDQIQGRMIDIHMLVYIYIYIQLRDCHN